MTAPTIHRTRRVRSRANQLADRVQSGEVLVVSVDGYGSGWYVLAVDRASGEVTVRRDGSEMPASWSEVAE